MALKQQSKGVQQMCEKFKLGLFPCQTAKNKIQCLLGFLLRKNNVLLGLAQNTGYHVATVGLTTFQTIHFSKRGE